MKKQKNSWANRIGEKFNRLTLESVFLKSKKAFGNFRCECGELRTCRVDAVSGGSTIECKICAKERYREKRTTHGMTETGAYGSWRAMRGRINNPNDPYFHRYGGRGISYDPRWDDFKNFYADMGDRPEGLTLDRFPNKDGDYCKENCRWATAKEQSCNTTISTPPEVIEQITLMWETCKNKCEIARSLGLKNAVVGKILRKKGLCKARPHKWYTDEEKAFMLAEYKSGRTISSISKNLGRDNKGVANYLDRIGARD